jgi:uncharacterized membrane protein
MVRLLAVVMLCAVPAMAEVPLPAAFAVQGVAADDILNIRAEPDAASAVVGTIPPDALGVEVVRLSDDGAWGQIGTAEGNGWVAMRFLSALPAPEQGLLPRPMRCFGTEPFWSVTFPPTRGAVHATPEGETPQTIYSQSQAQEGHLVILEEAAPILRTLMIAREACSDGMSDRTYGFSVRMFTEGPEGNSLLRGCCTLDQR